MIHSALIVEDLPSSQTWLEGILLNAFDSISIETVDKIAPAKVLLNQRPFDLVLLDISLPDGSGLSLIEPILARSSKTYIVITTIFDDDEHLFAALEKGAQGFLLKDQSRPKMVEQLRGILDGEPPLSPSITRRMLRHFRKTHPTMPPTDTPALTGREVEIVKLLALGHNRAAIASTLSISEHTVATHIKHAYRKLDVSNRAELVIAAMKLRILNDV